LDGEPLSLTRKEFDLLALLATRKGEVVSRDFIVDQVWQAHWEAPSRTLDTHIAALRGKLGGHVKIETVRGVGYRLAT
jgi:DNA-binding response OmpR family regulator